MKLHCYFIILGLGLDSDLFYLCNLIYISLYSNRAQEEFEEHAEKAKTLPETTTNESKLILYGLYKQATVGAVNTSK